MKLFTKSLWFCSESVVPVAKKGPFCSNLSPMRSSSGSVALLGDGWKHTLMQHGFQAVTGESRVQMGDAFGFCGVKMVFCFVFGCFPFIYLFTYLFSALTCDLRFPSHFKHLTFRRNSCSSPAGHPDQNSTVLPLHSIPLSHKGHRSSDIPDIM